MKKIIIFIITVCLIASNAAAFGVGGVVTDPGSYTYYVEQIKVATEELENLKEQLDTAKSVLDETQKMRGLLEGAYNHAFSTIERLRKFQQEIKERLRSH